MKRRHIFSSVLVLSLFLVSSFAMAGIYMDEGFEGAVAFQDQNFPVRDASVTPPTAAIVAVKGIRLRAHEDASGYTGAITVTNTGTVSTADFFEGTKSLNLASGQSVGSSVFPQPGAGNFRSWQFAVHAASSAFAQTAGTVVGSFSIEWQYGTKVAGEGVLQLDLVVESATKINLVCENNGANLGSMSPDANDWRMVSVIIYPRTAPELVEAEWYGVDPLGGTNKGPHGVMLGTGAHIFVGQSATSGSGYSLVLSDDIGAGWATTGAGDAITLLNWSLAAKNGGGIYVDNLYWDNYYHDPAIADQTFPSQEMNARMTAFDKAKGPVVPPVIEAGASTWDLY